MALQVTGAGVGCCCPRPLPAGSSSGHRRLPQAAAALCRPPRAAVASGATTVVEEDEGKVRLGGSGVAVTKLGIGAWSWGDTTYWNDSEWDDRRMREAQDAFDASIDNGMTFFDTAEVYADGSGQF